MKIWLTGFGVVGENASDLQPTENPHDVGDRFGAELIASGRAEEYDPARHDPKPAADAKKK